MNRLRQRKAFTIVEMVIVIAVIAILATVLIPTFGNIIQKAHVSADTSFAGSLTMQLAVWEADPANGKIENESDLQAAIDSFYGEGYYASLEPKSGKHGYHFWYDVAAKQVVLKSLEELAAAAAPTAEGEGFSNDSLRSGLVEGYFLMGNSNNDFSELIRTFENLTGPAAYETAINNLVRYIDNAEAGSAAKFVAQNLYNKVAVTTIVNGLGAYRFNDVDAIRHVYVPITVENINVRKVFVYTPANGKVDDGTVPSTTCLLANPANVNKVIIPVGVKIATNGFPAMAPCTDLENPENVTILYIPTRDLADLTDAEGNFMFDVQTTNPIFQLANGAKYVVDGSKVYAMPYTQGDAPAAVEGTVGTGTLENLDVEVFFAATTAGQGDFYYDTANKILYVRYDLDEVAISVTNGYYVEWAYSVKTAEGDVATDLITVEDGLVKINKEIAVGENNMVTVTANVNGEAKASFTVCLVRPNKVTFGEYNSTLHAIGSIGETPIELIYDGINTTFTFAVEVNYNEENKVAPWDAVFESEQGKFTVTKVMVKDDENNDVWNGEVTITLQDEYAFNDTLIITVGDEDLVVKFAVKCEDRSGADFSVKPIVDINNDGKLTYIDTNDDGVVDTLLDIPMGGEYLFRVGNDNAFTIGNLFYNIDEAADAVRVEILDLTADATGKAPMNSNSTFTVKVGDKAGTSGWELTKDNWSTTTVDFNGTGIAKIKIGNVKKGVYTVSAELIVEVVDGKNVVTYDDMKNATSYVFLTNITMSQDSVFSISGGTLYGNGFTFNISKGDNSAKNFAIVNVANGTLDNVKVMGATYTTDQYTGSTGENHAYSSAAVRITGTCEIVNSYIYGCRAPIRLEGTLTVKNTILEGGNYANVDIRSGQLILDNAVTNNTGLGIVVDSGAGSVTITGTLKQHNWVEKGDKKKVPSTYQAVFDEMFTNTSYQHKVSGDNTVYVNTGILILNESTNAIDVAGYLGFEVSYMGYTRKVYTLPDASYTLVADDLKYRNTVDEYPYDRNQGYTKPTYQWTYPAEYDSQLGKIVLAMNEGETVSLNPHFLKAFKYGKSLVVSVSVNGTTCDGDISFTEGGTYELVYTITDDVIYDQNGVRVTWDRYPTYTKTVTLQVNVVKKDAAPPDFTFYYGISGNKSAGSPHVTQPGNSVKGEVVKVGDVYYMSAGHSDANNLGKKTINGVTIYYPIVDGINVRSGTAADYDFTRHYPIFKGVTIQDGTDAKYTYAETKEMPSTLTWVTTNITGASGHGLKDEFVTYDNKYLCRVQKSAGNEETGAEQIIEYRYTAEDGNDYVYYICYKFYNEDESACVTGDTLVTLADGTQKEIQQVTAEDMLLVWNHFTGKYEAVPAAIIFNHGYDYNTVIKLNFSDGTQVKVINLHQFLDANLKQYVTISADTVAQYVGHSFVKQDGDTYTTVTLESYEISEEYIEAYGIISAFHYNILVEGMFSTDFMEQDYDLFNYFTIGEGMVYDAELMQKDIEQYGLYTYEDFADYLTYEQFVAFNVQYFKIAVGKGHYTYEGVLELINEYLNG